MLAGNIKSLFALALLLIVPSAYAQGCPPGQYPVVGQGWNYCAPVPGSNEPEQQQAPQPRLQNQWQALAADAPKGILGTSSHLMSRATAESAAISDCERKGGSGCIVLVSAANGCVAMITGDKFLKAKDGETKNEAEQNALKACSDGGDTNCRVYYSACSFLGRSQ